MIDLTPLDVRTKVGDFHKAMRGYDPAEVDAFLGLVAERLEERVKETLKLREKSQRLDEQVGVLETRERAVQEALVTAQKLREDVQVQAEREATLLREEAEAVCRRRLEAVDRAIEDRRRSLEEIERRRLRFLKAFRRLLQRELAAVDVEEVRELLDDTPVELELGRGRRAASVETTDQSIAGDASGPSVGGKEDETGPDTPHEGDAEASGDGGPADDGDAEEPADDLWLSTILKDEDEPETAEGEPRA